MAEWLGRGLQNLLQQFESARTSKAKDFSLRFFNKIIYGQIFEMDCFGIFHFVNRSMFHPWTYHEDIQKTFTGFYTEKNI